MFDALKDFLKLEAAGGLILVAAAAAAMIIANSPLEFLYSALIELPVEVRIGDFQIEKALLL